MIFKGIPAQKFHVLDFILGQVSKRPLSVRRVRKIRPCSSKIAAEHPNRILPYLLIRSP
jgi:hypothetical protein